ncbi:RagB/SusD family nutrient uptake outer membrane protein [Dyadobacter fanqingshengii]|uniref:RagB/SusD family nutrient uptake outer membrane protein n=1 Tax=Dyadobacter fanqingshengii TaxID=2906443 RepID=A0A9X1PB04_9BACT|nr:RagB/SusD family nutrient uptake outer membrane protein [Dyadobacter fanqingshengii]MCF0041941.1 RagB/SusD family nutrient uptake outer membrane protein [Dyadobacter fanqingshengii]USJ36353.1 RagB/SusD family nutrient uptake outer membrane protein [Dyadobacter fanqingshengii]
MQRFSRYFLVFVVLIMSGCAEEWLDRKPQNIILEEQIWNDPKLITGLLANYYDRLPYHTDLNHGSTTDAAIPNKEGWQDFAAYDEAMWSNNDDARNNIVTYAIDRWRLWDYVLVRDINLALENIEKFGTSLSAEQKVQFSAELRFLRAQVYFDLVKRMGGVPLVTKQLIYDYNGDPSYLQQPRAKEEEVYDFIASELDAIKEQLGNGGSNTRANKYTAMALKSRAMLYAGSIAKYNNLMASPISTPGGEVGIPASRANDYYAKSLAASEEIINSGVYQLYKTNPNLGENFYDAITKKSANPEIILAQDFLVSKDKRHGFTYDNIARNVREDNLSSSSITPSLNLVEDYEYLDGTSGELKTRNAGNTDYIYYNNVADVFANKDARLYGTVVYPGTSFRGTPVQIQAGVKVWNGTTSSFQNVESNTLGSTYEDGGLLTGSSGPQRSQTEVTNSGFYLRKYVDQTAMSSTRGIRSDMWWVRYRLGEIYLNAAEAALETGKTANALKYVNMVRERAGFGANSLKTLTIARLQNERRVELAFEDHRVWDLKRWRIAHELWNGNASNPDAVIYALYPYRVVRPGHATHGKYVFDKLVAPRFRAPRFFQMGNYYSSIEQLVIDNNPKIVRNPFH